MITLIITGCPIDRGPQTIVKPEPIKNFPIYLKVDSVFNQEQRDTIERSIESWRYVSNNKINIIPIWNQTEPQTPLYKILDDYNGIFIWFLSKEDPFNLSMQLMKKVERYSGYYVPSKNNNINYSANIMVFNEEKDPLTLQNIILHELGHLLRLKHMSYVHSIMYPVSDYQTCISQWDAKQLCDLYKCIPRPECQTSDEQPNL